MELPPIFKLNDYCVFEIFKQIKLNCEENSNHTNPVIRYKDIISFVSSDSKFNDIFLQWNGIQNKSYITQWTSTTIYIFFHSLYETLKNLKAAEKNEYLSIFKMAIEENNVVGTCLMDYSPTSYHPEHVEIFEMTTRLLQQKRTLNKLILRMKGYTPENLQNFRYLRNLQLDVDIEVSYLIEIIKSNPNLNYLDFECPGRNGKISDIAVYCQKLEGLNIEMNPNVDAGDYIPFAKLPRLQMWNIRGTPMKDSFHKLFQSLAESTTLKELNFSQMDLNPKEIIELSNLRALRSLYFQLQSSITNIAQNSNNEPDSLTLTSSTLNLLTTGLHLDCVGTIKEDILAKENKINIFKNIYTLEQYIQTNNKDIKDFIVSAQTNINSLYTMKEMCNKLNIPTDINKISSFFVLKSFVSLLKKYAESLNLLPKLKNLEPLLIQMKINIRNELSELQKTIDVDLVDIEQPIPLDPTSQGLILLYLIEGLSKIFNVSLSTNVEFDRIINNSEIILYLTTSFNRTI
ncbi:uncharacterized protein Dana_GF27157, isoform B [Drosophila ananassae]|uniref:Uncharacterized protein, isoform B n=1 Tax=Drosophila ananassae TaxID=7217 RepID=A0A0P8ZVZ2_DROAN|nr:uncharacterized protein LOC26514566 [Drosophila ananassae]KPU78774.1 uncharacterized protein Dana_GF27157, isoform B [Drosophila ananassae]